MSHMLARKLAASDILVSARLATSGKKKVQEGEYRSALVDLCEAHKLNPFLTPAVAWQIPAHYFLNEHSAIEDILDYKRLVKCIDISNIVSGLEPQFGEQLTDELLTRCQFYSPTQQMPIVNGKKTNDLLPASGALLPVLEDALRAVFVRYLCEVSLADTVRHAGVELALRMWANAIAPGGEIGPHYHTRSWISAVYYPIADYRAVRGGLLQLGPMPFQMGRMPDLPQLHIEPAPGLIVVFPSYFGHRVLKTDQTRVSIAADLLPIAEAEKDWNTANEGADL